MQSRNLVCRVVSRQASCNQVSAVTVYVSCKTSDRLLEQHHTVPAGRVETCRSGCRLEQRLDHMQTKTGRLHQSTKGSRGYEDRRPGDSSHQDNQMFFVLSTSCYTHVNVGARDRSRPFSTRATSLNARQILL